MMRRPMKTNLKTTRNTILKSLLLACALFIAPSFVQPTLAQSSLPTGAQVAIPALELRDANVLDAVRLLSELGGINMVATAEAAERKVSNYLRDTNVHNALDRLCRVAGLWYRFNRTTQTYLIMTSEQYKDDLVIYRDDIIRSFVLKHQNVVTAALTIESLFGSRRVQLNLETEDENDLGSIDNSSLDITQSAGGQGGGGSQNGGRNNNRRNNRNSSNRQGGGSGNSRLGADISLQTQLQNEQLTSNELALLRANSNASGAVVVEQQRLNEVTNREPVIYLTVNRQHNLLLVRTSDEAAMSQIEALVAESDRPTPQVLLEMRVLEVRLDDEFRSSFDISGNSDSTIVVDNNGSSVTVPKRTLSLGNFPDEGGTAIFTLLNDQISARLELFENEGRVNTLATPLLLASNNRPAQLFIGTETVLVTGVETTLINNNFAQPTLITTPDTEVRNIGNQLDIIPRINGDRPITLLVRQTLSNLIQGQTTIPVVNAQNGTVSAFPIDAVDTSRIETTVLAQDGLTVAIGGLIRKRSVDNEQKVPVVGDIPLLGNLFKRKATEDSRTELVLLITPHVFFTSEEADIRSRFNLERLTHSAEVVDLLKDHTPKTVAIDQQQEVSPMHRYMQLTQAAMATAPGQIQPGWIVQAVPTVGIQDFTHAGDRTAAQATLIPTASWQVNDLHITRAVVRTSNEQGFKPQHQDLKGQWLSVSFGKSPANTSGQHSNTLHELVLISEKPFLEALHTHTGS